MKNKLNKEEIYDFLSMFFILVGNYLIYSTLSQIIKIIVCTSFIVVGSIMTLISVIKKVKNKEYTKKQYLIVGVVALTAVLVWHRPAEIYVSTLLAMKYINEGLRKLIKNIFFASVISYAFVVLLWLTGLTVGVEGFRENGMTRYSIGFNNPNVAVRFFLPILLSGMIFFKNDYKICALFIISSIALYMITNSRAGVVVCLMYCFLSLLPKSLKRKFSNIKVIPYAFVMFTALSVVISLFWSDNEFLNMILNQRAHILSDYISNVKFFGQIRQANYLPADNIFIHTLYYGGIYGFIVYLVIYFTAFRKTDCENNYNIFILFLTVFIYGLVENYSNQGESFYLLLVMIQLLNSSKLKELDDDYKEEIKVKEKEIEFKEETI